MNGASLVGLILQVGDQVVVPNLGKQLGGCRESGDLGRLEDLHSA